jgi:YD repeat-containing protein
MLASGHSYEAFGALKQVNFGNGLAAAIDRTNEGRITARRLWRTIDGSQLSNLAYSYDGDDNVAAITNQLGPAGSVLYGYDKAGRLSLTVTDPGSAVAQTLAYSPGTNRLASLSSSAGTRTVGYDARGNTLSETRPGAVTLSTAYDGHGRLTGYTRSDAAALSFAYNGLDERVAMTAGAIPGGSSTPLTGARSANTAPARPM